jgi:F0F1-type ATP synthase assembly protein I
MEPSEPKDKRLDELKREYAPQSSPSSGMSSIGLELGLVVVVLALGGWWLDKKFGTSPWLLLIGCFVGIVGGLYRLIRSASKR